MRTFDDFDAWNDSILGAELRTVCDRVESRRWGLGGATLGEVAVQIAEEGGGNLAYGRSVHPGPILFLPLSRVTDHVVNGERLDEGSLLLIPPFADFRIQVRRHAHAWCSIALPPPSPAAEAGRAALPSGRVAPGAALVGRLRRLVLEAHGALGTLTEASPAHAAAGDRLLAAASACLAPSASRVVPAGRPRIDRARIVRKMMERLEDAGEAVLSPAALAVAVGVHERTLQRAVRETYAVTTKEYLLLRSLHAARRRLTLPPPDAAGVTDVLAAMGIWEFGRFAGRYRRHFGELPSQTLRRARA